MSKTYIYVAFEEGMHLGKECWLKAEVVSCGAMLKNTLLFQAGGYMPFYMEAYQNGFSFSDHSLSAVYSLSASI